MTYKQPKIGTWHSETDTGLVGDLTSEVFELISRCHDEAEDPNLYAIGQVGYTSEQVASMMLTYLENFVEQAGGSFEDARQMILAIEACIGAFYIGIEARRKYTES